MPNELLKVTDQETFEKSRSYAQDKRAYNFVNGLYSQVESYVTNKINFICTNRIRIIQFAHIFYIIFFVKTRSGNTSFFKLRPVMLIAVLAYLIELMYLLWPHLGGMKIPVLAYGVTISVMLSAALWQYQKLDAKTALYFIIGASFFVASDSILAINKFRNAFENAGIYIMITYIIAQVFIVMGAIRYRTVKNDE